MKHLYSFIVLFPLVISCGVFSVDAPSNQAEQDVFIAEMNAIIAEVANPLSSYELDHHFFSNGHPFSQSKFVLFGENHVDYDTLMLQARAFQTYVKSDDLVLFEGNDAGKHVDCASYVFDLYVVKKWNETKRAYDVDEKAKFAASLSHLFAEARSNLDLYKLKLQDATCMFWDNLSAFDLEPKQLSLTTRNSTMVDTMQASSYRNYGRIFVIAGKGHLPSGDLDWFKAFFGKDLFSYLQLGFGIESNELYNPHFELPRYYEGLEQTFHPMGLEIRRKMSFGSTKAVYEFLQRHTYLEMIPKTLLQSSSTVSKDLASR